MAYIVKREGNGSLAHIAAASKADCSNRIYPDRDSARGAAQDAMHSLLGTIRKTPSFRGAHIRAWTANEGTAVVTHGADFVRWTPCELSPVKKEVEKQRGSDQ